MDTSSSAHSSAPLTSSGQYPDRPESYLSVGATNFPKKSVVSTPDKAAAAATTTKPSAQVELSPATNPIHSQDAPPAAAGTSALQLSEVSDLSANHVM